METQESRVFCFRPVYAYLLRLYLNALVLQKITRGSLSMALRTVPPLLDEHSTNNIGGNHRSP